MCSKSVFTPMPIRIIPPKNSAKRGLIKRTFSPILTPISEIVNRAMKIIATKMANSLCFSKTLFTFAE